MGLDFIELFFQMLGRGVCNVTRLFPGNHFQLSEEAHEVIGFIFVILLFISTLAITGASDA